jgi:peptidoglycan/xylan/chitin deacetylase (PgdA/CDA1 family)
MRDRARQPLVLAYHAVTTEWRHPLAIDPGRLREQLHKLAARGFRGATFTAAATGESSGRIAVITFDDGFRSAADHAVPILDELGWPATVFTVTSTATNGAHSISRRGRR